MITQYKNKLNGFLNRFSRKKQQLETIAVLKKRIQMLEDTQRRTENYLTNIIRVIPANIYWQDLNCVILGGNLSYAKHAGFSDPKDVIGKTDYDFAWKEHAHEVMENSRLIMKSGVGSQFEEVGMLADGKLHTFLTCKAPLRDKDNQVIGIIGVSTDITDFKALQQELLHSQTLASQALARESRAKAIAEEELRKIIMVLVGDIVHNLRTPLVTIKVVADILETMLPVMLDIIDEAKEIGAKKINLLNQNSWDYLLNKTPTKGIQNSIAMINDLINTTLAELATANKAMTSELACGELTKHSSRRIIENTLKAYPFSDVEKNKIKKNITCDFLFMGNSIIVMKLLFTLIKNAFEQIALNGKGELFFSTEAGAKYNLIRIKDTAGGAPTEIVSNFFKGYFTTKDTGTGIGLAFAKKTMISFGGDIECLSVYGESMEFILKFPVVGWA